MAAKVFQRSFGFNFRAEFWKFAGNFPKGLEL
jgi:hypothetical protein